MSYQINKIIELMPDGKRLIVVVGHVGVGKSTFIENLQCEVTLIDIDNWSIDNLRSSIEKYNVDTYAIEVSDVDECREVIKMFREFEHQIIFVLLKDILRGFV